LKLEKKIKKNGGSTGAQEPKAFSELYLAKLDDVTLLKKVKVKEGWRFISNKPAGKLLRTPSSIAMEQYHRENTHNHPSHRHKLHTHGGNKSHS
jgi:hypothetical protein